MSYLPMNFIKDINPKKDLLSIKVRIIRIWKQTFQLDMILLDEMGEKIQAYVKKPLVPIFDDILKEDTAVVLTNFGVVEMKHRYPIIYHKYRLTFYRNTRVQTVTRFAGSLYGFRFIPFRQIIERKADSLLTVDVIGNVFWCGDLDVYARDGKDVKRISFDIEDLEGNQVRCILWNVYAQQFKTFIANHATKEHVIVVLQHARLKYWKGVQTVQNDMLVTRLFINDEISEINSIRKGFITKAEEDPNTHITRCVSSQSVLSVHSEFIVNAIRKYVAEISESGQEFQCVVLGTIKFVQEEYGWFYNACRKCAKKVISKKEYADLEDIDESMTTPDDSFWCRKCKTRATSIVPKFKVHVRVQDATGSVSFVLFDRDVMSVVGVSANDIRERQLKDGSVDVFPTELKVLINKMFAFKIDVSSYNLEHKWNVYTVLKICDDPKIISEMFSDEDNPVNDDDVESVDLGDDTHEWGGFKDAALATDDSLTGLVCERVSDISPLTRRKKYRSIVDDTESDFSAIKRRLVEFD